MSSNDRKRGAEGSGGGNKRAKRKYFNDTSKAQSIPFGARGVLVSCITGKEIPAAREAIAVFYEAYEVLCPASVDAKQAKPSDGDISALLANEVADLKDLSKQPFVFRKLGIPSLTFIEVRYAGSPSPTELVAHICRSAQTEKQNKTRLCSRFYPIEHVCPAKLDDIQELAKDLAATHFPEQATPVSFAVEFDKRAAPPGLERMEVINAFARAVPQPPHKVSLSEAQKTIMVNVAKGSCGVAVVDDFKKLAKFNLRLLASAEASPAPTDGPETKA